MKRRSDDGDGFLEARLLYFKCSCLSHHFNKTPLDHGSGPLNKRWEQVFTCNQSPLSNLLSAPYEIPSLKGLRASHFSASSPRHPYGSR